MFYIKLIICALFIVAIQACDNPAVEIDPYPLNVSVYVKQDVGAITYTVTNADDGSILDSGLTGYGGAAYTVSLPSKDAIYIFCITGSDPYQLCSVTAVYANQPVNIGISSFTHIAFGLYKYLKLVGLDSASASIEANKRISALFPGGKNITTTYSYADGRQWNIDIGIAIRSFELLANQVGSFSPLQLANELSNDLANDGLFNLVVCPVCQLNDKITLETMRNSLATNVILTSFNALQLAQSINSSTDPFFRGKPVIPINDIKPVISNMSVNANQFISGIYQFQASASDVTGIDGVTFIFGDTDLDTTINADGNYLATVDTSLYPDGPHSLIVVAVNKLFNSASESLLLNVANTRTVLSIDQPSSVYASGSFTLTAEVVDPYSEISDVVFLINGNVADHTYKLVPPNLRAVFYTPKYVDGPIVAGFRATNISGFVKESEIALTIDNENPVVAIYNTLNLDYVTGDHLFEYSAADNYKLDSVELILDGKPIDTLLNTLEPPSGSQLAGAILYDSSLMSDGRYALAVKAQDAAGNTAIDSTRDIIIDNTPPTLEVFYPLPDSSVTGRFTINLISFDAIAALGVRLFVSLGGTGVSHQIAAFESGPQQRDFTSGSFTPGVWQLTFIAYDKAGNTTTLEYNITIY